MNRNDVLARLKISLSTFKRWCRAHDISTNRSAEYTYADLAQLQKCKEAMASGVTWDKYLESIGKERPQTQAIDSLGGENLHLLQENQRLLSENQQLREEISILKRKLSKISDLME